MSRRQLHYLSFRYPAVSDAVDSVSQKRQKCWQCCNDRPGAPDVAWLWSYTVIAGEINERERDFIAMNFGIQTWSKFSV